MLKIQQCASLVFCGTSNARVGGAIRFEWSDGNGNAFHLTGGYLVLEPHRRIVHVERMFLPDATPDNHVETHFEPLADGTLLTVRMTLRDEATRTTMLATGREDGMEASYARLEQVAESGVMR